MDLAQMREFTNAYYGTGTAFQIGTKILSDVSGTIQLLSAIALKKCPKVLDQEVFENLYKRVNISKPKDEDLSCNPKDLDMLEKVIGTFDKPETGILHIANLLTENVKEYLDPLALLREMFLYYAPFRYSIENKEMALNIRSKRVIHEYTRDATDIQKQVLELTENEAELTKEWVLKIQEKESLTRHLKEFNSTELELLHKIQSRFLRKFAALSEKKNQESRKELSKLSQYVQMTILAVSEGLGFGG
jgi:hypothetical protein